IVHANASQSALAAAYPNQSVVVPSFGNVWADAAGPAAANPFVNSGGQQLVMPYIPGLQGGADVYGLTTLRNGNFSSIVAASPAGAGLAIARMHLGPFEYGNDFAGYDMLFLINVTGHDINSPVLGVDQLPVGLLVRGTANNPTFTPGAAGPQTLHT